MPILVEQGCLIITAKRSSKVSAFEGTNSGGKLVHHKQGGRCDFEQRLFLSPQSNIISISFFSN
jgi:hypothetical protein